LAGALLTLLVQGISRWWSRPILKIAFEQEEPGCFVNTNLDVGAEIAQGYLRLKVRNTGRSTAKDVSLCVVSLSFPAVVRGAYRFGEEVLDLKVAMTTDTVAFRLAAGAHQYIDLAHTDRRLGTVVLATDFVRTPVRLTALGFAPGTYRAEVFASAENAASVHGTASWSWDGQFPGLQQRVIVKRAISVARVTERRSRLGARV